MAHLGRAVAGVPLPQLAPQCARPARPRRRPRRGTARHHRARALHGHRHGEVRPAGLGLQPAPARRLPQPHAGRAPPRARLPAGRVLRLPDRRHHRGRRDPLRLVAEDQGHPRRAAHARTTWTTPSSTTTRRTRRHRPVPSWPTAPTSTTDRSTSPTPRATGSCSTCRSATATPAGAATRRGRSAASPSSSASSCSRPRRASWRSWACPHPGHPYWNEATLAGVQARYPGLDMAPWRDALR